MLDLNFVKEKKKTGGIEQDPLKSLKKGVNLNV